ncbi:hypothetical protein K435DRAFT_970138 [Dendrothele bispora CBS 962.96]|uniref:DUF4110 domain-containing protein n=1 Tax=Dendrothele bispora (strain CBS 962.96) TaxID=1314807 RepID=A0A4S8LD77_DENBC|nr:hypothetical protein K435DRAFT_970138 [Dendrothele bispora CBS 962.96]
MAKKKASASKTTAKAAKKTKAAQKVEKKEKKKSSKTKDIEDDDDLESILERMRKEWEEAHTVTEELVEGPPSRRANATLTTCPNGIHLWCIGGEFFSEDGRAFFYNDVFRYSPDKDEWRKFVSPTCPGPRSAHAVAATAAGGGKLFLFAKIFHEKTLGRVTRPYRRPNLSQSIICQTFDDTHQNSNFSPVFFRGEFSSLHQTTFHHYRDFWVFDIPTHSWERIETKVRPTARSGHRMAMWKYYVVLFGGFYDPGVTTRYLNDLWIFNTQEYSWRQVEFKDNEIRPSPRSGFSFLATSDGIVLHGGYCKEYVKGKRPVGVMLEDTWFLKMTLADDAAQLEAGSSSTAGVSSKHAKGSRQRSKDPLSVKWERRKRPSTAYAPTLRSGCTMAAWTAKSTGVMFGGVTDEDTSEETLESVFWNDLNGYQWTGKGRWVSMTLRKPKKPKRKGPKGEKQKVKASGPGNPAQGGKQEQNDDEDDDTETLEDDGADIDIADVSGDETVEGEDDVGGDEEQKVVPKVQKISLADIQAKQARAAAAARLGVDTDEVDMDDPFLTTPLPRYNAMLAVLRNTLYIYGGIFEKGSREYTLDDFYSIQLDKMDRFVCLKESGIIIPDGDVESSSDDDDEDDDDDDDDDYEEDTVVGSTIGEDEVVDYGKKIDLVLEEEEEDETEKEDDTKQNAEPDIRSQATAFMGVAKDVTRSPEDILNTPLPGETLTLFYARSREYWTQKAYGMSGNKGKQLKREGFGLAEERYASYKPVLEEVEKILAEAGLDEEEMRKGAAATGPGGRQSRNKR